VKLRTNSCAARCCAMPACRQPVIDATHPRHQPRNPGKPCEWLGPPNLTRQRHRCIRAAILLSVRQQDAHFAHQLRLRQAQQCPYPDILQRSNRESASLQNRRDPPRNPRAESAVGVKEQPSPRMASLPVRKLRSQRDHGPIPSLLRYFVTSLLHRFAFYPAFFPSRVTTFPRSFTTLFSAPVGIRKISSNNPVMAVKNSCMLSNRSRV
jgi:hypothetical protein